MSASKSLRVLIIRNAYQQDAGGAEQYSLNLAIALKRAGHKPVLVTKVQKIHQKSQAENIKCIAGPWHDTQEWDRLYYLRYPLYMLWYIMTIIRHRIDAVNPQSRDDFVFATHAARFLRRRVIWTDHADLKYILDRVKHPNPRMRSWIVKASKQVATITIASKSEAQSIHEVAPELTKLTVIHNGVFAPKDIKPVPKPNKLVVGTNARLVASKGIGELMEAFAALGNKQPELWLLGGVSGNKAKYSQMAKNLGILNQVKFWDYVSNPNDVVAAMDIFVHASYHEAFSLAIIEAAMLGKPIIATAVGGTPEIINASCGILVEPKKPEQITKALNVMINNKNLREKLGKAVQQKTTNEFDFQKIVENKIIPLYKG